MNLSFSVDDVVTNFTLSPLREINASFNASESFHATAKPNSSLIQILHSMPMNLNIIQIQHKKRYKYIQIEG